MSAGGSAPTNGGLCLLNERNDLHVADTTCPSLALTAGGALWLSSILAIAEHISSNLIAAACIVPALGAYWHGSITSIPRQVRTDEAVRTPVFGQYMVVEDEEIEAVQIESTRSIDIDRFVPKSELDERYIDSPYYPIERPAPR